MKGSPKPEVPPEYRVVEVRPTARQPSSHCLVDERGEGIEPVNQFLDYVALRGLSESTVRSYAYDLLNFWRWFKQRGGQLEDLTEFQLLEYIRFQKACANKPASNTINHRLTVVGVFYHFVMGKPLPSGRSLPQGPRRSQPLDPCARIGHRWRNRSRRKRLRVQTEKRVIVPLTVGQVADFMASFRTCRDLAILGFMLACGLRSREILNLSLPDVQVGDGRLRVKGKGRKERILPIAPDLVPLLRTYLESERPESSSQAFFLVLKGPHRGQPMTPAGLRALFRYHRRKSGIAKANPHRFRHTFACDMVRAGMSLPALMQLMGHEGIQTTMVYVEVSPQDVWEQFYRAVAKIRTSGRKLSQ